MTKAAQELWEIVSKAELNALIEAANGYLDGDYTAESLEGPAGSDHCRTGSGRSMTMPRRQKSREAITNLSDAIAEPGDASR